MAGFPRHHSNQSCYGHQILQEGPSTNLAAVHRGTLVTVLKRETPLTQVWCDLLIGGLLSVCA